jgi:hypothetical protein
MAWLQNQVILHRAYPRTIPFDILDFALGTGWISFLIVAWFLSTYDGPRSGAAWRWSCLALIQFAIVALLARLPAETSRVWLFMLPLWMIPIGVELARWNTRHRMTVYALLATLSLIIFQNMTFIQV